MKVKHVFLGVVATALATTAQAQVKVGSNPASISTNAVLDVEGTSGSHSVILQNGNVGVGTTTPGSRLDVVAGANTYGVSISGPATSGSAIPLNVSANASSNNASTIARIASNLSGNSGFVDIGRSAGAGSIQSLNTSAGTTPLVLNPIGGSVGIGTSTPSYRLDVLGDARFQPGGTLGLMVISGNTTTNARLYSLGPIEIQAAGNPNQLVVAGNGFIGMGDEYPDTRLCVNGGAKNITGSWLTYSDSRIKTIDASFTDGLNVINKIQPVRFHYKSNAPFKTKTAQVGIVAQELEAVAPYMVSRTNNSGFDDLRQVDNQAYVFLLINAIKEQQAQINALKKQNAVANHRVKTSQQSYAKLSKQVKEMQVLLGLQTDAKAAKKAVAMK